MLALLRALPRPFGAPVQQNVAQVPDGGVYRCFKINITIGAVCAAIFAQLENLGGHALLPESARWQIGRPQLIRRNQLRQMALSTAGGRGHGIALDAPGFAVVFNQLVVN